MGRRGAQRSWSLAGNHAHRPRKRIWPHPVFEFYADRLLPIIANARGGDKLIDFASALDSAVCGILGLTSHRIVHSATEVVKTPGAPLPELPPSWQVRAGTLGFIPGLSILDLIFNLGPEAPLLIRAATR